MVISQPPGNNPSYYYRALPTLPQLLWMFPETPYVLYMQLQHQVIYRNGGAIGRIFWHLIRSTEGSSADCSLFILSLHALALHLSQLKYYFKSFCMKIWARWPHIHLSGCISLQNASRTALCYATNTIKWKHSHIFHKSSTKQRRSDQIETIKTIMRVTRLVSHGRFYHHLGCHFLKKYSIKCEKI